LRPIKRSRNSESRKPGAVRLTQLSIETICLGAHQGTSATQQLGLRVIFPLQCRAARFEGHHWLAHDVAFNRPPTPYRRFDLCLLQGEMIRRNCFALRSTASTSRLPSCGRCAQNGGGGPISRPQTPPWKWRRHKSDARSRPRRGRKSAPPQRRDGTGREKRGQRNKSRKRRPGKRRKKPKPQKAKRLPPRQEKRRERKGNLNRAD